MILVVILNVVLIVMQFISDQDCQVSIKEAEIAFLLIFYMEVVLKVFAYGPKRFIHSGYNL